MAIKYRTHIRPNHAWASAGFDLYAPRPATREALTLADELLNYKASHGFTVQIEIEKLMARLRNRGVTARDVLIRVAEFVAFLDSPRGSFASQRAEDHTLARLVIYLTPLGKRERRPGARVLSRLGPMVRDACFPYAAALVRKLNADADERRARRLTSADLDRVV